MQHVIPLLYCPVYIGRTCNSQQLSLDHPVQIKVHWINGNIILALQHFVTPNQITFYSCAIVKFELKYIITDRVQGWIMLGPSHHFFQCGIFNAASLRSFQQSKRRCDDLLQGWQLSTIKKPQQLNSDPGSKVASNQLVVFTNKL